MAPPTAPKPTFIESTETVLTVEFAPLEDDSVAAYDLCWKEYPRSWEDAEQSTTLKKSKFSGKKKVKVDAENLTPGTTYTVRLVAKDADGNRGDPSAELVLDTDAVSCGPKKSRCTIL
uniref:Fibronectin type-III domain-containing protein n=1 Tax=Pseudictyota dubia TaxID=2749911 RepID=A0A6U1ZUJ5_9STRA|mmetsp:Transcript_10645/g.20361  ORF Transcript_10645/g.20361 Transcript_10645/m.20361 type:complete len:118 (+) Transcript_10645:230-583(+)